ncbi:AraC family transcriptional regulator [bacterium]|nr:AraC family transcriptional regulator [bacterium]
MSQAVAVCHGEFGRAALYRLDKDIITHAHREGHLIFYVDGPSATCISGKHTCKVDADHAVAVSPWEPHSYHPAGEDAQICLVLYIKPMWFLENTSSAEYALKFGCEALVLNEEIKGHLNRLTCLLLDHEGEAQFDALLFALTKACFDLSWAGAESDYLGQIYDRFSDYRVRRSLRLIQENVGEEMEMEELARNVGLSRPHFFKLFKQYTGVTPNVYMNTLRSERAIEELLNSDKTVTDIAFDLGFSSQASFTRFFSSNVGIAPSEYRRVAHVSNGAFPMM